MTIGFPRYDDQISHPAQTALTGVTQWTLRQIRSTGIVVPHLADADVFSVSVQMPHRKQQGSAIKSFHIHYMPVASANGTIIFDYSWGFFNADSAIPSTLPNTGSITLTLATTDQYKHKIFTLISDLLVGSETYSGMLLVKIARNGGTWGASNEIALLSHDCHILIDRLGSVSETSD